MINPKDLQIIAHLRQDARQSLVDIGKKTLMPTSTVFDKVQRYKGGLVKKYTALVDFPRLGYGFRVWMVLSTENKNELKEFLSSHGNVNSLYKINNGFDFLIDCVFKNWEEVYAFQEKIKEFKLKEKITLDILDEVKREEFLVEK